MGEWKRCFVNATGAISRFFSFFSVQRNEVKSNLIAITGDTSGDTEQSSQKEMIVQDCRYTAIVMISFLKTAAFLHTTKTIAPPDDPLFFSLLYMILPSE